MERKFQINLADYIAGPEELDLLLKEWLKTPRPKTINQIARMYLTHLWEIQTGFLPYDRRTSYSKGAKIAIILAGQTQPRPAKVTKVSNKAYRDSDGFTGDIITVNLLSQTAKISNRETADFLANYQGEEKAGRAVKALQIIKEKDEAEVIPKILLAISDDKRFVKFEGKWLPKELLIEVSGKMNKVEKIIAESGRALSTDEILEKLYSGEKEDDLKHRLEFSLNYSLSKNKNFILVYDKETKATKWNLRKKNQLGKINWTVTIQAEWIEKGILIVPGELATYMKGTNTVHILYDQLDDVLTYEENNRLIEGLKNFYSIKAVAEFDKVHLRLEGVEPIRLFIAATWRRSLDELLRMKPQDLDWENSSLRDCIIVTLAKFETPANYREIYAEIAQHKNVSLSGIEATLSHYYPSVFTHVGWDKWQLAGWEVEKTPEGEKLENSRPPIIDLDEKIWKAVQEIEENDYVYKLLQKIKKPLSFNDICEKLANFLKVEANKLKATGFLKPDNRFRRLDDSTWALEEWFRPQEPKPVRKEDKVSVVDSKKRSWAGRFWLVLKNLALSVKNYYSRFSKCSGKF